MNYVNWLAQYVLIGQENPISVEDLIHLKKLILSIKRAKLQTVLCTCGWLQAASKLMKLFSSFWKRKGKQISRGQNYSVHRHTHSYSILPLCCQSLFSSHIHYLFYSSDSVLKTISKNKQQKEKHEKIAAAVVLKCNMRTHVRYDAILEFAIVCIETVISNFAFDSHQLFSISSNKQWRMNEATTTRTDRYISPSNRFAEIGFWVPRRQIWN